ncbi:MAG: hypothetical protein WKF32_03635 [Thermoleophilaceae bacterium]
MGKYGCALLVALLAAAGAAGCGGDEPLSKAAYIEKGDAICKKSDAKVGKAAEKAFADLGENEMPTEKQLAPFVEDTLKPEVESQISELRDLSPPKADEDKLNKIYDDVESGLAKIEDNPKILLEEGNDPLEEPNKAAQDYGFKVCGQS